MDCRENYPKTFISVLVSGQWLLILSPNMMDNLPFISFSHLETSMGIWLRSRIDQDRSYGRSQGGSWGNSYDDYRSVSAKRRAGGHMAKKLKGDPVTKSLRRCGSKDESRTLLLVVEHPLEICDYHMVCTWIIYLWIWLIHVTSWKRCRCPFPIGWLIHEGLVSLFFPRPFFATGHDDRWY